MQRAPLRFLGLLRNHEPHGLVVTFFRGWRGSWLLPNGWRSAIGRRGRRPLGSFRPRRPGRVRSQGFRRAGPFGCAQFVPR